jgi:hypothetical protein
MPEAASRTATLAMTLLNGAAAAVMRAVSNQFDTTAALSRETVVHRLLFVGVLCIGCVLRFYGLGAAGLHGDEDTMALAVTHILQDGRPILPSGMFYPRGLTELYLMALSVSAFGMSEWAMRLPSALCGVALIALAYAAGKRFLRPSWNLAFAATVALLPEMIDYSQTARMYIFMLTCVAAFLACVFAWERSRPLRWLVVATLALVFGIDLHPLSVTLVLVFLMPALLQADRRKLMQGLFAACIVMLAYLLIDGWVNAQYPVPPPEYAADLPPRGWRSSRAQHYPVEFQAALLVSGAFAAIFAIHLGRKVPQRLSSLLTVGWMLAALVAQLLLYYHLAALLAVAGFVTAYRATGQVVLRRVWILVLACGAVALIQVALLASRPGSITKLIGSFVGQPSVWPYVRISEFSVVAALLVVAAVVYGLLRIATRRPAPDYCLLAVLGIWIPLFVLGLFTWNMPSRYTSASVLPLLLCGFAFAQGMFEQFERLAPSGSLAPAWRGTVALLVTGLAINPPALIALVTARVELHPDHKGAAQFVRSLSLRPDDILLAEDVLQQTYYLGHVDYWLMGRKHARRYVQLVDGQIRDFYTGTPVIDDGEALRALLESAGDRRVFIIGSGENQSDHRRDQRGPGISQVLSSDLVQTLYVGRDGLTKVWRAAAPARVRREVSSSEEPTALRPVPRAAERGHVRDHG